MKKYKLAVFDMAGTTVEEGGSVYRVLKESIEKAGFEVPAEKLSQIAGMSKYEAIRFMLPDDSTNDLPLIDKIFENFRNQLSGLYQEDPSITEKPGISELFRNLRKHNILLALNTGYSRPEANILIEKLEWGKLIDFSITSDEVERGRPHPDMIKSLMKKSGVKNSRQVIKVGDTVNDMLEGINAQCGLVVGVLGGAHQEQKLKDAGADLILDKTADLIHIL